jgi:hypothetical protein
LPKLEKQKGELEELGACTYLLAAAIIGSDGASVVARMDTRLSNVLDEYTWRTAANAAPGNSEKSIVLDGLCENPEF